MQCAGCWRLKPLAQKKPDNCNGLQQIRMQPIDALHIRARRFSHTVLPELSCFAFPPPGSPSLKRRTVFENQPVKEFILGENLPSVGAESEDD